MSRQVLLFFLVLLFTACSPPAKSPPPLYNEASLKKFVHGTAQARPEWSISRLDSILKRSEKDSVAFRKTIEYLTTPFAYPNSGYRNEELYIQILREKLKFDYYSAAEKELAQKQLDLAIQNRVGDSSNDFTFVLPGGEKRKMHEVKSPLILLFFYNPDCPACKEFMFALVRSEKIRSLLLRKTMKIVAIYPDADVALWKNSLKDMPASWILGRDQDEFLFKNGVYDLHAIPTAYLLDENKKVLMKDVSDVELLEKYLLKMSASANTESLN